MDVEIGRDRYRVVDGFFRRPKGWTFVEVADVAVDPDDNVYVFCRGTHPVMIFDREGRFLDAWGDIGGHNYFTFPHGLTVGLDGFVYTADSRDHSVRKFTKDGKLLMTLGQPHQNAPAFSGQPFNRPTHATVAPNGDLYVSDGYGNARIHCFSPEGQLKFSWGRPGHGPGEFNTVHSVFIDPADETLYAADRFNNRVQFFSLSGEYRGEWNDLRLPQSVRKGPDGAFYVAELSHRVTVLAPDGTVRERWGDGVEVDDHEVGGVDLALPDAPSRRPMVTGRVHDEPGAGLFCAPHGIAVDSQGSFYVADTAETWIGLDRGNRSIQKFAPV
ncbi:MAG TPA: peptidyl-alpha-hydroxyglycine alpha-amidating lyase family protein [Candidatus Limnocylindrales bacterium]|nr:peptidyl-alpha-hydroxyglycine alpha-amidating lyase family protein [Candidatus Limnocylindrales bacterium]